MRLKSMARLKKEFGAFPIAIFLLYVFSFGSQAIYSTYHNLYLSGIGFSQPQIGMTISVSTFFALIASMTWGVVSDRAKRKNTVILLLFGGSTVATLLYYLSENYVFVLGVVTLYTFFYTGLPPCLDNIVLEASEGKRWKYGQMRMGGTVGYCLVVLCSGFMIGEEHARIFYMTAIALFLCFLLAFRLPAVPGHRTGKRKTSFRVLLKNRPLMIMIGYNLSFMLGLFFFYSFYPIYFRAIGGTSAQIGVMMFFCAVLEIPCLFWANRVVKRFGVERVLIVSALVTALRWALLSFLRDPTLIIATNMLHGIGYTGFSYCLVVYINEAAPQDLKATSQNFNALIGGVFPRLAFGYVGGLAAEAFGTNNILLAACAALLISTLLFSIWAYRHHRRSVAA